MVSANIHVLQSRDFAQADESHGQLPEHKQLLLGGGLRFGVCGVTIFRLGLQLLGDGFAENIYTPPLLACTHDRRKVL